MIIKTVLSVLFTVGLLFSSFTITGFANDDNNYGDGPLNTTEEDGPLRVNDDDNGMNVNDNNRGHNNGMNVNDNNRGRMQINQTPQAGDNDTDWEWLGLAGLLGLLGLRRRDRADA